jgi:hypothetical protein
MCTSSYQGFLNGTIWKEGRAAGLQGGEGTISEGYGMVPFKQTNTYLNI